MEESKVSQLIWVTHQTVSVLHPCPESLEFAQCLGHSLIVLVVKVSVELRKQVTPKVPIRLAFQGFGNDHGFPSSARSPKLTFLFSGPLVLKKIPHHVQPPFSLGGSIDQNLLIHSPVLSQQKGDAFPHPQASDHSAFLPSQSEGVEVANSSRSCSPNRKAHPVFEFGSSHSHSPIGEEVSTIAPRRFTSIDLKSQRKMFPRGVEKA